jgi:hypothetical protein
VLVYYVSKSGKGFEAILPPLDPPEGKVLGAFKIGEGVEKYEKEAREKNRESWYLSWALDTNLEGKVCLFVFY